jgi:hypothetical protein
MPRGDSALTHHTARLSHVTDFCSGARDLAIRQILSSVLAGRCQFPIK